MAFIIESDFEHKGIRCVCIGGDLGHRCGYVGIPEGHFLHGKQYSDPCLPMSDVEKQEIGKRGIIPLLCHRQDGTLIAPDLYFNVHGSLTYSGGGKGSKYPVESDLWWLGFDCAHTGDGRDADLIRKLSPERLVNIRLDFHSWEGETVRTKEYVEQECRYLVDQIIQLRGEGNGIQER
jgi:hypothetical protein